MASSAIFCFFFSRFFFCPLCSSLWATKTPLFSFFLCFFLPYFSFFPESGMLFVPFFLFFFFPPWGANPGNLFGAGFLRLLFSLTNWIFLSLSPPFSFPPLPFFDQALPPVDNLVRPAQTIASCVSFLSNFSAFSSSGLSGFWMAFPFFSLFSAFFSESSDPFLEAGLRFPAVALFFFLRSLHFADRRQFSFLCPSRDVAVRW